MFVPSFHTSLSAERLILLGLFFSRSSSTVSTQLLHNNWSVRSSPFADDAVVIVFLPGSSVIIKRGELNSTNASASRLSAKPYQTHLTVVDVLFGIKRHNYGKVKTKRINHIILITKMCISMYKKTN